MRQLIDLTQTYAQEAAHLTGTLDAIHRVHREIATAALLSPADKDNRIRARNRPVVWDQPAGADPLSEQHPRI